MTTAGITFLRRSGLPFLIVAEKKDEQSKFVYLILMLKQKLTNDHVTNASSWQSIESGAEAFDGDDVQVLSARVIGAVDHGTDG